jgi:hypothetical protein
MMRTRFQCFQTLNEGEHNDPAIGIGRMARSAALLSMQARPSRNTKVSASHRVSM